MSCFQDIYQHVGFLIYYHQRARLKFCKNKESDCRIQKNSSECLKAKTNNYALLSLHPKSQKATLTKQNNLKLVTISQPNIRASIINSDSIRIFMLFTTFYSDNNCPLPGFKPPTSGVPSYQPSCPSSMDFLSYNILFQKHRTFQLEHLFW